MKLYKQILTNNDCYKTGEKIKPKGIMVHSTGANNPNLSRYVGPDDGRLGENKYGNHWNQARPGGRGVCVHAFIGKLKDGSIATYQTLPWDHRGWHAAGKANDTHISFEICEDGLTNKAYFEKVYKEAAELCAYLCKLYGLTEKDIICHKEGHAKGIANNHGDVLHWWPKHGKTMDDFRAAVKALLPKQAEGDGTIYRLQLGAWHNRELAEAKLAEVKAKGFTDAYIVESVKASASAPAPTIKKGSTVRVNKGAKTYTSGGLASFVYERTYNVSQVDGDRVVITDGPGGTVVAAVKMADLTLIK